MPVTYNHVFLFLEYAGILKIERSSVCGGRAQGSDTYLRQCSVNVTLPQNSQGKGVAAVVPAAPFQVLFFLYTDQASHGGGNPAQETGRLSVSCHLVPIQFRTWDL